ncbi:alpha/beta hydrolase [Cellulomonas sp. DKR-3]|uniref:Alpha/beta hydrolase n=1 Tax=Cellulomonas fulva TaxID=2835530 RepID=A0ABS5U038_9CELL|nr:acyl-CoA thioester hydrolase/BAAT C-terminal domain-containing protein [Cellulomonas fulva]MBT0994749.1 alpha/beta hydrolase [Cellulomonas fulva]
MLDEGGVRARWARGEHLLTGGYRVVASTVLGIVVLAVLGAVMGPQWDPVPLDDPLVVTTTSTQIGEAPQLRQYEVQQRVVTVQLDGATVQAQLSVPVGLEGPAQGVVFVHGAGTGTYDKAFVAQARSLAEAGVVTLVPDKRLDTYSARYRDYVAMAGDYQRSVELLRTLPEVDPDRVGVYAESEGAWIAPVMAAQDQRIAFVLLISAPVVPPREQAAFAADSYLRNTGVPHGVFRAIPRAVGMAIPGGGFEYVDFDVTPYQRRMTQPVLMVYGTADASMPIVQGPEQVIRDTAIAGNYDVTVRYYEDATHGIKVAGTIVPDFLRDLTQWVVGLPATGAAQPKIAGAQPTQTFLAMPVPEPRWLHNGDVVALITIAAIAAVVLGGLVGAGARVAVTVQGRRAARAGSSAVSVRPAERRSAHGVVRWSTGLGAGAIATVVGLVWYIFAIARLALDYEHNDVVVKGGWVAVRLVGIATVVAAVLLLRSTMRARRAGRRIAPGLARQVALWSVVVGCAALLVVLAYWGVYQLGI